MWLRARRPAMERVIGDVPWRADGWLDGWLVLVMVMVVVMVGVYTFISHNNKDIPAITGWLINEWCLMSSTKLLS